MRLEEQEGKTQPRLWSTFLLNPRTNPALEYPSLGRMGTTLLPTPSTSVHPHHTRVHWRLPGAQRVRKWQGQTLSFSLEDKYLLPGDPPREALQGGRVE